MAPPASARRAAPLPRPPPPHRPRHDGGRQIRFVIGRPVGQSWCVVRDTRPHTTRCQRSLRVPVLRARAETRRAARARAWWCRARIATRSGALRRTARPRPRRPRGRRRRLARDAKRSLDGARNARAHGHDQRDRGRRGDVCVRIIRDPRALFAPAPRLRGPWQNRRRRRPDVVDALRRRGPGLVRLVRHERDARSIAHDSARVGRQCDAQHRAAHAKGEAAEHRRQSLV